MRLERVALGLLLAALLLSPLRLAAQAQGQLFGHVSTAGPDGQPLYLPQAKLVLVDKADPKRRFQTQSDDSGAYSFLDLPGGVYTLTTTLQSYDEKTQDVAVEPGTVQELTVELTLKAVQEQVTVRAETQGIQPEETKPRTVLPGTIYDTAPLVSERFIDALPLVPGVVRGPDGLMKIKGAPSTQTGWLVNSANVTDPVTGAQAINLPVDVIQEIEVLPNPYAADYGKFAGAVTTIETRPSSDRWIFRLNNFLPRPRRRAGHFRGFESVTPRLTVSGPLVKNKLSILQSWEYILSRNPVTSLPPLAQDTEIESFNWFTQLDATFSPTHKLTAVFSLYPEKNRFANLNTFNPQPTTANYRQRGWMVGLKDRAIFTNGSLLESTLSLKRFDVDIFPATPGSVFLLRPERDFGSFFDTQNRITRRFEWLEVYNFAPRQAHGQHWLKVGVNVARDTFRGFHLSQPVEIRRLDDTLAERIEFFGSPLLRRDKSEVTFFLHDKWNVNRRLTFDLGARYDYDSLARQHHLAPRIGFAYVLTSDNRTLLRGGVGLFYDKIPLNAGTFAQLQQRVVTRFAPDGVTILDGPRTFVNLLAPLDNHRSLAFDLEFDRELTKGLVLRLGYLQREGRDDFIVEPFDSLGGVPTLLLAPRGRSRYREVQVTANYRFRAGSYLNLSYVHSQSVGDLNLFQDYFGNFENPILRANERSRLRYDVPDRLVAWGDIEWLWHLHWAPALEVRSGFPFSLLNQEQQFVGARDQGGRFPAFATLDLRLYRHFKVKAFGKERGLTVGVTFFNLLNHFNPRDLQQNLDAFDALGLYNSRGRLLRGKFAIDF